MRFFTQLLCSILLIIPIFQSEAYSTFFVEKENEKFLVKSYDWITDIGLLVVNKRGLKKHALEPQNSACWISKYGNISFTQAGREMPMGGMNEKGLVIELMWLDETQFPEYDERASLNELQWIQYQLDMSKSVQEVIESDAFIRIHPEARGLVHFLVADASGDVAIIEFLHGQMVVYPKEILVVAALTNHSYAQSISFLTQFQGFGGNQFPEGNVRSLDRFATLATALNKFYESNQPLNETAALSILNTVVYSNTEIDKENTSGHLLEQMESKWRISYDIQRKVLSFSTKQQKDLKTVHASAFNFSGATPVEIFDINQDFCGNIDDAFSPYTYEANRKLIDTYYSTVPFLQDIPEEAREQTARYPDTIEYVGETN